MGAASISVIDIETSFSLAILKSDIKKIMNDWSAL
jgi:hypothetical protein